MDLSKLTQHDKYEEFRVKTLLELSKKKYNLEKELESLKVRLPVKQSALKKLQKEVVSLQTEVPILEKQEQIAKETTEELVKKFVVNNKEIGKIQASIWGKINKFVNDSNAILTPLLQAKEDYEPRKHTGNQERHDKIRQLKVESEIEAMHLYEKYQKTKIEELKLIRDSLEGED